MFSADSGRLGTTLHLDDDIYEAVLSFVGHRAFQRRQDVLGARQARRQPRPRSGGHAWRLPPAFDVPADASHLWDGLPCSLVALGFVRVFARISATAAFLPSYRTSAIVSGSRRWRARRHWRCRAGPRRRPRRATPGPRSPSMRFEPGRALARETRLSRVVCRRELAE